MSKILITGIGLISKPLGIRLTQKGHSVCYLTRNPHKYPELETYRWNLDEMTIDKQAFDNIDYIIHLAGAGVSDNRWTNSYQKEILDSRINSTNLLFKTVQEQDIKLKGFIGAAAVGYYGTITTNHKFTENDPPYDDFLGNVCSKWETAIHQFEALHIRTIIYRTGVVFSKNGGAFTKLMTPIKRNIGAVLGSGQQIIPWIHIEDMINLYTFAIENDINGVFNAVSPDCKSNKEVTLLSAQYLKKKILLPNVPSFMLKILFGKMASILLYGSKVSPHKIQEKGYQFTYDTLEKAFENLIEV